jgi:hypothetical protein
MFVHDAIRFALYNRSIIEKAPLQLYCSALVYAPENGQSLLFSTKTRSYCSLQYSARVSSRPTTLSSRVPKLLTVRSNPMEAGHSHRPTALRMRLSAETVGAFQHLWLVSPLVQ